MSVTSPQRAENRPLIRSPEAAERKRGMERREDALHVQIALFLLLKKGWIYGPCLDSVRGAIILPGCCHSSAFTYKEINLHPLRHASILEVTRRCG